MHSLEGKCRYKNPQSSKDHVVPVSAAQVELFNACLTKERWAGELWVLLALFFNQNTEYKSWMCWTPCFFLIISELPTCRSHVRKILSLNINTSKSRLLLQLNFLTSQVIFLWKHFRSISLEIYGSFLTVNLVFDQHVISIMLEV